MYTAYALLPSTTLHLGFHGVILAVLASVSTNLSSDRAGGSAHFLGDSATAEATAKAVLDIQAVIVGKMFVGHRYTPFRLFLLRNQSIPNRRNDALLAPDSPTGKGLANSLQQGQYYWGVALQV